jgi:hypothetical protein
MDPIIRDKFRDGTCPISLGGNVRTWQSLDYFQNFSKMF